MKKMNAALALLVTVAAATSLHCAPASACFTDEELARRQVMQVVSERLRGEEGIDFRSIEIRGDSAEVAVTFGRPTLRSGQRFTLLREDAGWEIRNFTYRVPEEFFLRNERARRR